MLTFTNSAIHIYATDANLIQDRPWNDPGPRRGQPLVADTTKPPLKAIVLDFASVNNVDITSVQHLIDVRNQLDRYTAPDSVEWHFAHIQNRWTKRALVSAGFGYPSTFRNEDGFRRWKPIFDVAELGGHDSAAAAAEWRDHKREQKRLHGRSDIEEGLRTRSQGQNNSNNSNATAADRIDAADHAGSDSSASSSAEHASLEKELSTSKAYGTAVPESKIAVIAGLNRPLFHIDLTSALQSAIANVEGKAFHGGVVGASEEEEGEEEGSGDKDVVVR